MYPDFIGIGAQKAGTTWLHSNLQAHPEVWMPPIKELHYFDEKIHEPKNAPLRLARRVFGGGAANSRWRSQVGSRTKRHLKRPFGEDFWWELRYYAGAPDDGWYASLFEPGRGRVVGEGTPAYSTLERDAVARVHGLMPDAKIIFMMRNPIERVWSQTVMSFDKAEKGSVGSVPERKLLRKVGRDSSRSLTDYLRTLETWGAYYREDQIFVGFLEDVHFFPEETLRGLYRFLGVDPSAASGVIREKIHPGSVSTMPSKLAIHLARSYREDARLLEERFGGYASFWRFSAERLAERSPAKGNKRQLTYPLWESKLWEEWEGSRNISPQSGPLSSLRTAS